MPRNPQETADLVTFIEEIVNCKPHFLCSEEVVLIWFYKANKHPKDIDVCMNVASIKLSPQHSRLAIGKEDIKINYLRLNNKTYIYLSSKILSNSIWSLINLINSFQHNRQISQQRWHYNKKKKLSSAMTMK